MAFTSGSLGGRLVRVVFSVCVLLGEKLDDEDLVYVDRDFLANRFAQQGSAELLQVLLDIGELETAQILEIGSDRLVVARLLAQGDDVARFASIRGNIDLTAIYEDT